VKFLWKGIKKFSWPKLGNTNFHFLIMKLPTAGLLVIKNRKLLLAYSRNKKCFYLPGGKIDARETAAKALCREIAEEMSVTIDEQELEFYTHITAPAYGEENGIIMEQDCFFLHRNITPEAAAEIEQLKYFSLDEYRAEKNRAPGAVMILEKLKLAGYID
jgi:ADP-ribose pyrophosphatase YjhB (NUDIX family)